MHTVTLLAGDGIGPEITRAALDVIVTTNLFGDILSDLASGLVGGLGLTADLHPETPVGTREMGEAIAERV